MDVRVTLAYQALRTIWAVVGGLEGEAVQHAQLFEDYDSACCFLGLFDSELALLIFEQVVDSVEKEAENGEMGVFHSVVKICSFVSTPI